MSVVGIVIIGRNEGERFVRCLHSLPQSGMTVVYVDSGSTDDSVRVATERGVCVVPLDLSRPFTAARARNEGFRKLIEIAPDVDFVQFIDGDCEFAEQWFDRALPVLESKPGHAVVFGRTREKYPELSVYNRLCDMEWNTLVGECDWCGGIALMRRSAFQAVNGFDDSLIAGEEPELCARLRASQWKIEQIPVTMVYHDAAITRFGQWWRRSKRAGHAYAEVARRHGHGGLKSWRRQVLSNWFWAFVVPVLAIASMFYTPWFGLVFLAAYCWLVFRIYHRTRQQHIPSDARSYAAFTALAKFPMAIGQTGYYISRFSGRSRTIIEYKGVDRPRGKQDEKRVGYLVNQYPYVSHSFIRREIAGVESSGFSVLRISIRRPTDALVDEGDIREQALTKVVLDVGLARLTLLCLWTALTHPIRWLRAGRAVIRLGSKSGRRLREWIYFVEACQVRRWLAQERISHLHVHFGTNPADVAFLCQMLGGPSYSFTVHGPEEFDRPDALSLGAKIARAQFVVAVSSFGRSQLYRWCTPADWPKIHVVRCGVDDEFLTAGPLPPVASPRIICVGRLAEQKGQLILIEAAAQLAAAQIEFQLVLAGDGPMRSIIETAIERLGLRSRVEITGWLSNSRVRDELAAARVMALPSFAEGLPVVIMESLALGRPVVTTYVAGIPELVRDEINGWLVPPGDVNALAQALTKAITTEAGRLTEMGQRGAEAVRLAHNAKSEAGKIAELFSQSIARNSGSGQGKPS